MIGDGAGNETNAGAIRLGRDWIMGGGRDARLRDRSSLFDVVRRGKYQRNRREARAFAVTCDCPVQASKVPLDARVSEREITSTQQTGHDEVRFATRCHIALT
jgi:hypothetical protein